MFNDSNLDISREEHFYHRICSQLHPAIKLRILMTDEAWHDLSGDTLVHDRRCTLGLVVESESVAWTHIAIMPDRLIIMSLPSVLLSLIEDTQAYSNP